jgi:glycosyltransferase involved in cell wall biosynthesis
MRAVFIHDHRFIPGSNNEVYSTGGLPYSVWMRYLKFFSHLHVVGRSTQLKKTDSVPSNLVQSSGPNVSFSFVPNPSILLGRTRAIAACRATISTALDSADALIARTSELAYLAVDIARSRKVPYAVEVVACPFDAYWNHGTLLGKAYAPIAHLRQRHLLSHATHAIYVTTDFLQRRYPCPGYQTAVSNVQIPITQDAVLNTRLRRPPRTTFVFGTIGSLACKYKGIQTAFNALAHLRSRRISFEYRILGGGDQSYWRQLASKWSIADCVTFTGTLPSGDPVLHWLDDLDFYLQPSLVEGLPRALIEAMSRGCPSIGSTAGGIPELIESDCLHAPGDAWGLSKLLVRAVTDSEWRFRMAQRNFAHAKNFAANTLDPRRDAFWREFGDHAQQVRARHDSTHES